MARRIKRRADAAAAMIGMNRERTQQQRRLRRAGGDVPKPDRADDLPAVDRDERQAARRLAAFAQLLGRLGKARRAVGRVEQSFACDGVGCFFFPDVDHDPAPFSRTAGAAAPRRESRAGATGARHVCQM
jgi:hypothetical protein